MAEPRPKGIDIQEITGPIDHPLISPADFLRDNRGDLAKQRLFTWRAAFESGNAFLEIRCADARIATDFSRVSPQGSVAAGFPHRGDYSGLYNDGRFRGLVIKTHYDAIRSKPGERPVGCGGQDTAEAIAVGRIQPGTGITGFVDANVDQDPLIQGFLQAQNTMMHLKKDGKILVVTQDHRRAEVHPVGEFDLSGGEYRRTIPRVIRDVLEAPNERERRQRYNPAEIYANGMPSISQSYLSDEALEYLELADDTMTGLLDTYQDYEARQEVQNPFALVIRDSKVPLQVTYPGYFSEPGSSFMLSVPREKTGEVVLIVEKAINTAIDQIEYAVTQSVANHDDFTKPFSNSRLVLIETADMRQSETIAEELVRQPWMRTWHSLEGHQVFLAESRAGILHRIQELPKAT